jgi:hypothetical protein
MAGNVKLKSHLLIELTQVIHAYIGGDPALAQAGCSWIAYRSPDLFQDSKLLDLFVEVEAFVKSNRKQPGTRIIHLLVELDAALQKRPRRS